MSWRYYETGIESPEVLGSGSSFSNVVKTTSEDEAFQAYRMGGRNYLWRVTLDTEASRKVEQWNTEQERFR